MFAWKARGLTLVPWQDGVYLKAAPPLPQHLVPRHTVAEADRVLMKLDELRPSREEELLHVLQKGQEVRKKAQRPARRSSRSEFVHSLLYGCGAVGPGPRPSPRSPYVVKCIENLKVVV